MKTYLFIDNGTTGSIAVIYPNGEWHVKPTPIYKTISYTKKLQYINRINVSEMKKLLNTAKRKSDNNILVCLERPMVNASMFKTTQSAMRSLEATLICIEELMMPMMYVDSRQWQREMLPWKKGMDRKDLKEMSRQVGERLFPGSKCNGDCDAILGCEWARRKNL